MAALKSIRIRNYRCFIDHTVDFGRSTIVVGKNNAGKSTLIETLRLISVALRRFRNPASAQAPRWLDDYAAPGNGQRLDLTKLGIGISTIFYGYGEPPAIIEAEFSDSSRLVLYIGAEGEAHSVFFNAQGRAVRTRRDIGSTQLPRLAILPQITPLERTEKVLSEEYVRQNLDSNLASRHFRNQLYFYRDKFFDNFCSVIEETWAGVRIQGLEVIDGEQGEIIQLMVRDGTFVSEVGWMGHGLQMWLQTLWFIVRARDGETIVLDEPDVYMHPDLQRKLVRMLRAQNAELLIATHSTEILAEVDAANVLVLDRNLPKSSYATDLPAVQRIVEGMGSAQNLQISRLWKSKSLILVEGDDMKLLKRVHDLISPASALPLDTIPNWAIGGWNGWLNAIGSVTALQNSIHESIRCYCIFDSDYHLDSEIENRRLRAVELGIELHIHSVKEIENYLLVPSIIRRVIERSIVHPYVAPTEMEISVAIERLVQELLPSVQDNFVSEFLNSNRSGGPALASRRARELVETRVSGERGALGLVPGKELLSKLSEWSQRNYCVSFGVNSLIRAMRRNEVDSEVERLVSSIAEGRRLN